MSGAGVNWLMGMAPESFPVGYRFHPTDEELVDHYLKSKILGMDPHGDIHIIPVVDVCKWEPWDLPALSLIPTDDLEWFFFRPPDYKYPTGRRSNRATDAGYWKPTGKDRLIKSRRTKELIGTKKTLVFYMGRTPKQVRTSWVMHEYHAAIASLPGHKAYVLCRLKKKTDENPGPDNSPEMTSNGFLFNVHGIANMVNLAGEPADPASDIASDFGNCHEATHLSNETPFIPQDFNFSSDTEQGPLFDLPFPNDFDNRMLFHDGSEEDDDVSRFLNTLLVDQDELDGENQGQEFSIDMVYAWPQSPSEGLHVEYGESSSDTDSEVLQFQRVSSFSDKIASDKEIMPSPMAQPPCASLRLSSINQDSEENKQKGNVSNTSFTILSCITSQPEEKSVFIEAKERSIHCCSTDSLRIKGPITESKECKISQQANAKLSPKSQWTERVGRNKKDAFNSPETAAVSYEQRTSTDYLNLFVGMLLVWILMAAMVLNFIDKVSNLLQ